MLRCMCGSGNAERSPTIISPVPTELLQFSLQRLHDSPMLHVRILRSIPQLALELRQICSQACALLCALLGAPLVPGGHATLLLLLDLRTPQCFT